MHDTSGKKDFNPSGIGSKNGHFIGLPFEQEDARLELISVPWDVTVSYGEGTATAPENILNASVQLDLFDVDIENAWKLGIYMHPSRDEWYDVRNRLRPKARKYIDFLEKGGRISDNDEMRLVLDEINSAAEALNEQVYEITGALLEDRKLVGLVGGEHSVILGFLKALSEKYSEFGVLQIDAHMDLRESYENFTFSHASVFYNALKLKSISKLVQVGIRDCCEEEVKLAKEKGKRISVFFDEKLKERSFGGTSWGSQCEEIISALPQNVYVSFDIDGMDPVFCPGTGTPVPGGLNYSEAVYLLKKLVESGRKIIGFDLCEVAGTGNEWDGNVGARILYKLCNFTGKSHSMIPE